MAHETHPAHKLSIDDGDKPCSDALAKQLVARLGLTEREASLLLETPEVSDAQIEGALHVNIHAIAGAFGGSTLDHLATDPKVELGVAVTRVQQASQHVRVVGSALDKLNNLHGRAMAAVQLDADTLERVANTVMPQLAARARAVPAVREAYASLFAYHHARHPGRGAHTHAAAPAPAADPAKK